MPSHSFIFPCHYYHISLQCSILSHIFYYSYRTSYYVPVQIKSHLFNEIFQMTLIHSNFSFFFYQEVPEIALRVNGGGYKVRFVALENSLSTCVPHSIFRLLVQRPTCFAGNAPSIGPQPQVTVSHDLHISPKDLCGW